MDVRDNNTSTTKQAFNNTDTRLSVSALDDFIKSSQPAIDKDFSNSFSLIELNDCEKSAQTTEEQRAVARLLIDTFDIARYTVPQEAHLRDDAEELSFDDIYKMSKILNLGNKAQRLDAFEELVDKRPMTHTWGAAALAGGILGIEWPATFAAGLILGGTAGFMLDTHMKSERDKKYKSGYSEIVDAFKE